MEGEFSVNTTNPHTIGLAYGGIRTLVCLGVDYEAQLDVYLSSVSGTTGTDTLSCLFVRNMWDR